MPRHGHLLRAGVTLGLLAVLAVGITAYLCNDVVLRQIGEVLATRPGTDVERRLGEIRAGARITRWLVLWVSAAAGIMLLIGGHALGRRLRESPGPSSEEDPGRRPAEGPHPEEDPGRRPDEGPRPGDEAAASPGADLGEEPGGAGAHRTARERPAREARSMLVLVAEDDPVDQRLARRMLERLGHRVVTVGDGEAAAEAVQRDRYDLVLLGAGLLVLDGPATVRLIRADPPSHGRPRMVAVCSDREECRDFTEARVDGMLRRPLDGADLETALAAAAGAADARRAGFTARRPRADIG
ncbi:response regulator [Actinoplanes sp. G11-F43]|uniref:response regulator n=1 Tax=Actinoplanes sp. G11-F43 TaxID=3424130 RepID=UPI003D351389